MADTLFSSLENYLLLVPGIQGSIARGVDNQGLWWVKFRIDIQHPLAWQVIQEIGHVVNYLSLNEWLPTSFYPVSPPPYLNGGPAEFLSWMIESKDANFSPDDLKDWLEGRLPHPVNNLAEWATEEEAD